MDAWLSVHLPWLAGPWGWVLLLVVTLVPMVFVAVRRHAGGGMGGLGLAIAQRIAALHGGRLHTVPAPLGGTRLCLALPRTAAAGR